MCPFSNIESGMNLIPFQLGYLLCSWTCDLNRVPKIQTFKFKILKLAEKN